MASEEFHWLRYKAGESFFVPSLDPYRTALAGVRAAARQRGLRPGGTARYKVGIYKGLLGVLFTVPR